MRRVSQGALEVVRCWYARLEAGDPGVELCSPDIEIRNWAESPTPGPYRGHDGVRQWWKDVNDSDIGIEIQMFQLRDVLPVDESSVVTIQRASGRARYSGLELDHTWGAIIRVAEGLIVSAHGFATPDAAKKAAGLAS